MIIHCVFCNFKADVSEEDRSAIFKELEAVCARFDDVVSFEAGPNLDFEKKSQDHPVAWLLQWKGDRNQILQQGRLNCASSLEPLERPNRL